MLAPATDIVRLSVHVLAAAIWVGGQLVLGGLVPTLRRAAPAATTPAVARRFAQLAWPAFVVLVGTGIWNVVAEPPSHQAAAWRAVLTVKIIVVALSGLAAGLHQRARSPAGRAVWGAITGVAASAAVVLGVALAG